MNKSALFGLVITVIFTIGLVVLPQSTRAKVSPYSPPCEDSDIEFNIGCCPSDTSPVHNMCLTQDEIDERNARSQTLTQCAVGNGLDHNVPGLIQCGGDFLFGR